MSFLDEGAEDVGDDTEENGDSENVISFTPASSAIASLIYHRDTSELQMTFTDGRSYVFREFPEPELERWVNSPSVGGYFNAFVRGNY